MFIKEVTKKNKGYNQLFTYHRLMESYRSPNGPRHRVILNLGKLDLAKEKQKLLADRVETLLSGQQSLLPIDEQVDVLAQHYASLIIKKRLQVTSVEQGEEKSLEESEYAHVDLHSLTHSEARTIGAETVGISIFKELGLTSCLQQLGFNEQQVNLAMLSIVGTLVHPCSERAMRFWAKHLSGMGELTESDFTHLSNNALYRISDRLLSHKLELEQHLTAKERSLFSLKEKIILYDLTNTYFEGRARSNSKAKRGRSKEKRYDCPLVTLGLVIDEMGFPKASKILEGNVSEPSTLVKMIEDLESEKNKVALGKAKSKKSKVKKKKEITVVIDAGIATEDNLKHLKDEGYDYVCVARNKPLDGDAINPENMVLIKQDKANKVEATLVKKNGEQILYCKSDLKKEKEEAIRTSYQKRFEEDLKNIASSLTKKRGTKKYEKVWERIGRAKERYAPMAQYYTIKVDQKGSKATKIHWKLEKEALVKERLSGSYYIRTTRDDLDEKEIWSLYAMLTNVEDAFRSLKEELKIRPLFHSKEERTDGHLFIRVLAYHLLNSIQTKLHSYGIHMRWQRIREFLSTHLILTTSMTTKEGKRIHLRSATEPEPFHKQIYKALGLNGSFKTRRTES